MRPVYALVVVLALLVPERANADSPADILRDAEWQKRFLGTYGFLSGAEPLIRQEELELLREVIELMKVNPRAAAAMLTPQTGEQSSAALDFILANLHFQNGEKDAAKQNYTAALGKFPDFRRAHKNLGLLLVQEGDHAGALEHLSRAVELGDRDGRNYGLMGYCYVNLDNPLAAEVAYLNAILQEPETRDWKLGLARSLLAMEKFKEAVALFGSLIEADPDDVTSWMLQANAYIGLEQPMQAAVNLETVREMGKAQSTSLILLGDIYMNEGMTELAASAYQEVIRSDAEATQFETAYRAAHLLIRTHAYDDAKRIIASIDERYGASLGNGDELKTLTLKAKIARAEGRDEEAAKLLESIVERDGTRGDALLELASYYRSKGDDGRGLLMIERAQNIEAYEYQALLEHAQFKVASKDYDRAAELLREAIGIKREARVERFLQRVEDARRL